MASFPDHFPNEILAKIISYCEIYQVLELEQVCKQWKNVCQEYVWDKLTCIDSKAVGAPHQDYFRNFIFIVHRVKQVRQFYETRKLVLNVMESSSSQRKREALRTAIVEMVKKRTPDAVFHLDIVQDVLFLNSMRYMNRVIVSSRLIMGRAAVENVLKVLSVNEFETVKLGTLDLHDREEQYDSFHVTDGFQTVHLPVGFAPITRLVIGCLSATISSIDEKALIKAYMQECRISKFTHLKTVEIECIQFNVPSHLDDERPVLILKLYFRPNGCTFTPKEFASFLEMLSLDGDVKRNSEIASSIDKWNSESAIKRAEMIVHSCEFDRIEAMLDAQDALDDEEKKKELNDPINRILSRVFPALVDYIHIDVALDDGDEEEFIDVLKERDIFNNLKQFSVRFVKDKDAKGEPIQWDQCDAMDRGESILEQMTGSMKTLEMFSFCFGPRGPMCPSTINDATISVSQSLPNLRELNCFGLTSFPFLISVVKQASNLHKFELQIQAFEKEQEGMQWIKKLVKAFENCTQLRSLKIVICCEEKIVKRKKQPATNVRKYRPGREKFKDIWNEITEELTRLSQRLPSFRRLLVDVEDLKYRLVLDGRGCRSLNSDERDGAFLC